MKLPTILSNHPRLAPAIAAAIVLTGVLLAACLTRGPAAAGWVQALAAWVQAFLTAGAVGAAAWLQDRMLVRRETEARRQRLEGAASIARWCLAVYENTVQRARPNMHPQMFLSVFRSEDFDAAIRALQTIPLAELGDGDLTVTVLRLEAAMRTTSSELGNAVDQARRGEAHIPIEMDAPGIVQRFQTDIFNAAAGVERRVAELVGRLPAR